MKIKLQNTLTGNFYANGQWNADEAGAEIITSPVDLAVIRYTWEMLFVREIEVTGECEALRPRTRRQFRITMGSNWDILNEAQPGDLVAFAKGVVMQGMTGSILATYGFSAESESYRGGNGWSGKYRPYLVVKLSQLEVEVAA